MKRAVTSSKEGQTSATMEVKPKSTGIRRKKPNQSISLIPYLAGFLLLVCGFGFLAWKNLVKVVSHSAHAPKGGVDAITSSNKISRLGDLQKTNSEPNPAAVAGGGGLSSKRFIMELSGLSGDEPTGTVLIESRPEWAPIGAEHFHKLVSAGFYDQCRFFRVLPNFVVQFGIAAFPEVQQQWRKEVLKDDPVLETNKRGTITYATSGKNTRSTQLFINKKDNKYLDNEGFAPFAEVVKGMEWIDKINAEYKEKPGQGKIQNRGNEYLHAEFPNLSYIVTLREVAASLEK